MPLENSPSLENLKSVRPPDSKQIATMRARKRVWILIVFFAIALGASSVVNLVKNGAFDTMRAKGVVVGTVIDENNAPLRAFVFVIGTSLETQTDANGRFELHDVPAGQREIVIGYLGAGRSFPVTVQANAVNDVGTLQFVSTRVP